MKVPWQLHLIAIVVVIVGLGAETAYLFFGSFFGAKTPIPDVLVGRILGTLDMAIALVLGYYFTSSITQTRVAQRESDHVVSPKGVV